MKRKPNHVGKVGDVYYLPNGKLAIVRGDRMSAFNRLFPFEVRYKGEILTEIAKEQFKLVSKILVNCSIWADNKSYHPQMMTGILCKPIKLEIIIRGYLTGSAWRAYAKGKRNICGVVLPDGMKENEKFPNPIITPTTKDKDDTNISYNQILEQGIVSKEILDLMYQNALLMFEAGTKEATKRGLILVDTKYEFGMLNGKLYVIDEVHTPDSSRFWYLDGYEENQQKGLPQDQLSKEFFREWLIENGFVKDRKLVRHDFKKEDFPKDLPDKIIKKYLELYRALLGKWFISRNYFSVEEVLDKFFK